MNGFAIQGFRKLKPMKTLHFQAFIRSHRSQIKMFETIAILMVFFILLLFGFMFYTRIIKGTQTEELETSFILNAIEISEKIEFMPEITCSQDNIPEKGCVDILKLESADAVIDENRLDYFDALGYSKIHITEIYPGSEEWILYDFPKTQDTGKVAIPFPVSIYDPRTDEYAFGALYIDIYR